jgi:hypothetical protein
MPLGDGRKFGMAMGAIYITVALEEKKFIWIVLSLPLTFGGGGRVCVELFRE